MSYITYTPPAGGAGSQTLAQTLVLGNTTGSRDISVNDAQSIIFNLSGIQARLKFPATSETDNYDVKMPIEPGTLALTTDIPSTPTLQTVTEAGANTDREITVAGLGSSGDINADGNITSLSVMNAATITASDGQITGQMQVNSLLTTAGQSLPGSIQLQNIVGQLFTTYIKPANIASDVLLVSPSESGILALISDVTSTQWSNTTNGTLATGWTGTIKYRTQTGTTSANNATAVYINVTNATATTTLIGNIPGGRPAAIQYFASHQSNNAFLQFEIRTNGDIYAYGTTGPLTIPVGSVTGTCIYFQQWP